MDAATRMDDPPDLYARLTQLNDIGVALSRETDIARLLEAILVAAKTITHADGGTLYRVTDERTLSFEIMRNDTLNLAMGGTTGAAVLADAVDACDVGPLKAFRMTEGDRRELKIAGLCTTAARSRHRSTSSTRRPSCTRCSTASSSSTRAGRSCGATPSSSSHARA